MDDRILGDAGAEALMARAEKKVLVVEGPSRSWHARIAAIIGGLRDRYNGPMVIEPEPTKLVPIGEDPAILEAVKPPKPDIELDLTEVTARDRRKPAQLTVRLKRKCACGTRLKVRNGTMPRNCRVCGRDVLA